MRRQVAAVMVVATVLSGCGFGPVALAPLPSPGAHSQFFIGWWGEDGKKRALDKFSGEEGRRVTLVRDEKGARLDVTLAANESEMLRRLLTLGTSSQQAAARSDLPDGMHRKAVRHLKLFRRQKLTQDSSRSITFFKVTDDGKHPFAFVVSSKNGFQAFYSAKGRLLVAFVTKKAEAMKPDPVMPPEDHDADE